MPVSYARQLKPFLGRYCLECHNGHKTKGDLNLETFQGMSAGGKHGAVFLAGKPDASRMVMLIEGKAKPHMPPRKARQPRPEELGLVRAWIAAGARDDSVGAAKVRIPDVKPRVPTQAPVAALAYRPDGKLLAVGSYRQVLLIDIASGDVVGRLAGQTGQVTAIAFSADGHWLAVAGGEPGGAAGQLRIYELSPAGVGSAQPKQVLPAHTDEILDLSFRPDGKVLATCSYDRLIKLWDVATGRLLLTLRDHSDAVYSVAFSPDGKRLASGSADRAVKIWESATGRRLYTLSQPTDWVYAVAWSPDGQHLAAAGVDKNIRMWRFAGNRAPSITSTVFAHSAPVTRLIYSADGKTLYSLSEDRSVKAWDSARMVERKVYPRQSDAVLALAVRPDQKQLALGRYDGALLLVDSATGKMQSQPLPEQPKPPRLLSIVPGAGQRGKVIHAMLRGEHLNQVKAVTADHPGATVRLLSADRSPNSLEAEVFFPPDTPAGVYKLTARGDPGPPPSLSFTVDPFPATQEQEPNDSATTGQTITVPATVAGKIDRAGDVDYYRFRAEAGQQIGVQALAGDIGSKLDSVLELTDSAGRLLMESTTATLGYTVPQPGTYAVGIRDRDYRGGEKMGYRLSIGTLPVVTGVFPLGLCRGTEATIHLEGVNLPTTAVTLKADATATPGSWLPIPLPAPQEKPLGNPRVVVGEFPETVRPHEMPGTEPMPMPVPGTANGRIASPGGSELWSFSARKGQRLVVEVHARRLGSPLDSFIEILDAHGRPLPRATLRCVSKTYTAFRDHDSAGSGIRLESWSNLAVNDFLLVGTELMRLRALPRNPDDDAQFFIRQGRRMGFLGTTPTYHSLGTPMYKVEIHPPGTQFPPNGLPVVTLYYQNDDGGPGFGKDSMLSFDPPADGVYRVRVRDARGLGGSAYAYRLTVRPPRPAFNIHFKPEDPAVWKGGAVPITASVDRIDGFQGPIAIHVDNLPPGISAPDTFIPFDEEETALALYAEPKATMPANGPKLRITARANIDGKEMVRTVTGSRLTVVEPGDIVTSTDQAAVTIRPGGQVKLTARIERRNGFKGRVPLDVRGLPHGVHVLDVGLNGILITEQDTSRTFVLYAEPWVQPMVHPFVVLAEREGKGTEHAARSVLLRVERP